MIGVSGGEARCAAHVDYLYANIVVKDGVLEEFHPISNPQHPGYNALYQPIAETLETQCDPVFIGEMWDWHQEIAKWHYNEPIDIKFFTLEDGYMIKATDEYYEFSILSFDKNGLLHSETQAAIISSSYHLEIFAVHGNYTAGKLNRHDYDNVYVSSGKVTKTFSDEGLIEEKDIKNLYDYSGPAYVLYPTLVYTLNDKVYTEYPR